MTRTDKKVMIVLMPWASPDFPGLGPALVRSVLRRDGIGCDMVYGNLVMSRLLDGDPFVERQLTKAPISEVAFSPYYFEFSVEDAEAALKRQILGMAASPDDVRLDLIPRVVKAAGICVESVFNGVAWEDYDVVGFSVMMQQTVASLALAKRLKAAHPHLSILFGGPNTSAPMGGALLRSFPEIDYVLEGEVDETITPLVRALRAGERRPRVPGLLWRDGNDAVQGTSMGPPVRDLDGLPVPEYDAFFDQIATLGLSHLEPTLQFETSRGCWWGQKHHCTFCGIDDNLMVYRTKSADRVMDEIIELTSRHRSTELFAVDSIINYEAFKTTLPVVGALREAGHDYTFFFETKSNIKREQAQMFRRAGVNSVQPGIESFSDHVLELMDKGTTGVRQVQCLKLLEEAGVNVNWNMIYRNLGEQVADYDEILAVIPYLHHLTPLHGEGLIPMQLNRYAPNHNDPATYGISRVFPKPYYADVFPDPKVDIDNLAFYFDFETAQPFGPELGERYATLAEAVKEWGALHRPQSLRQARGPGFIEITDERIVRLDDGTLDTTRHVVTVLDGVWADIFTYCDEVRSVGPLIRRFAEGDSADAVAAFIDWLCAERLVYRSPSGQVVNLPLLLETSEHFQPPPRSTARFVPPVPTDVPAPRRLLPTLAP